MWCKVWLILFGIPQRKPEKTEYKITTQAGRMENVSDKFDDSISMENVVNSVLDVIQPNRVIQGEIVTIDADFAYVMSERNLTAE